MMKLLFLALVICFQLFPLYSFAADGAVFQTERVLFHSDQRITLEQYVKGSNGDSILVRTRPTSNPRAFSFEFKKYDYSKKEWESDVLPGVRVESIEHEVVKIYAAMEINKNKIIIVASIEAIGTAVLNYEVNSGKLSLAPNFLFPEVFKVIDMFVLKDKSYVLLGYDPSKAKIYIYTFDEESEFLSKKEIESGFVDLMKIEDYFYDENIYLSLSQYKDAGSLIRGDASEYALVSLDAGAGRVLWEEQLESRLNFLGVKDKHILGVYGSDLSELPKNVDILEFDSKDGSKETKSFSLVNRADPQGVNTLTKKGIENRGWPLLQIINNNLVIFYADHSSNKLSYSRVTPQKRSSSGKYWIVNSSRFFEDGEAFVFATYSFTDAQWRATDYIEMYKAGSL